MPTFSEFIFSYGQMISSGRRARCSIQRMNALQLVKFNFRLVENTFKRDFYELIEKVKLIREKRKKKDRFEKNVGEEDKGEKEEFIVTEFIVRLTEKSCVLKQCFMAAKSAEARLMCFLQTYTYVEKIKS